MKRIMCTSAFFIILVLGAFVYALAGPLPDTGQTKCYDYSNDIACPQLGESFYGQDASFLINPPSYTKLDDQGKDLPDDATEWAMVRDNVTGLIWEVKTDDGTIHDKDNRYPWQNAQDVFIAELNTTTFGGYSDWRLPTIKELTSIENLSRYNPTIDTYYFPETASNYPYWSCTPVGSIGVNAWYIYFDSGRDVGSSKSDASYVRAVCGGQSDSSFVDNRDDTVTDTATGLMWQQVTASTMMSWEAALSYSENLSLAEYSDWRLPNRRELRSIVDYEKVYPAVDTDYFPDTMGSHYWSSTSLVYYYTNYTNYARAIYFHDGSDAACCRDKLNSYYVRAVRGGQNQILGHLFINTPGQASGWDIGNSMAITWDTQNISGNVKISISRQGGKDGTFEIIAENTVNDGSYDWTVTGSASVNCVLKIEPLSDISKGTTQGLFTIYGPPPTVTTGPATSITSNSATLNGTVNPNGASTTVIFEYGTTTSYGSTATATQSPLAGTGSQNVSASLTGLNPSTTYHFRVKATNSAGAIYGDDQTFTTSAPPVTAPTVTTGSATSVTASSATLSGTVNPNGSSTTYYFEYGTTTSYGSTTSSENAGSGSSDISATANVSGLSANTTYHYRLVGTNTGGTTNGNDHTFTTLTPKPTLSIGLGAGTRGEKITLPITLSNVTGTDIAAVSVDVGYDTSVFEKAKAAIGPAGDAADKTISTSEPTFGVFRITVFSTSNNNVIGDGVVAYLTLDILSNAPGSSTELTNTPSASDPSGSDVAVEGADGTVTLLGYLAGDCNGDGTVSIAEVQSAINMYLEIIPVEECVDVNDNGKVSIGEVQKVINNHLDASLASDYTYFDPDSNISTEGIVSRRVNARSSSSVPLLDIGYSIGEPGETVTVSISLGNTSGYNIAAISCDISYDISVFEDATVTIGPAGSTAEKSVTSNEISSGVLRIGVLSTSNSNVIGNGVVVYLTFSVRADASLGQTTLENSPEASDPSGNDVSMEGSNGAIRIAPSVYVQAFGTCGGNTPCYSTIQAAIDPADTESVIRILQGTFNEDIIMDRAYDSTLSGGWDPTFTNQSSNTVINSLTITSTSGTVEIENVVVQ